MQLYKRPAPPDDFDTSMAEHRQRVEQHIKAKRGAALAARKSGTAAAAPAKKSSSKKKKKADDEEDTFKPVWGTYKAIFALAQFSKCGFCDNRILSSQPGDVEHYRPKSKVSILKDDPKTQGQAYQASATVKGRSPQVISEFGYWWEAYAWENYLLACNACNRTYKGTLFPVREKKRTIPPRQPSKKCPPETPLLLNPFEKRDPAKHLKFYEWGSATWKSGSPYGKATVQICGLDRPGLIQDRKLIAIPAFELADELSKPAKDRDKNVWRDCYRLGREDKPFSGMVRAVFKDKAKVDWETILISRAQEIAQALRTTRDSAKIEMLEEDIEEMGRIWFELYRKAQDIYKTIYDPDWGKLVARRAASMARNLRAARDVPTIQKYRRDLYDLACGQPKHAATVKTVYEQRGGATWDSLQSIVEDEIKPLKKLEIK